MSSFVSDVQALAPHPDAIPELAASIKPWSDSIRDLCSRERISRSDAVRQLPPPPSVFALYASVVALCKQIAGRVVRETQTALTLEDLLMETVEIFAREIVTYDASRSALTTFVCLRIYSRLLSIARAVQHAGEDVEEPAFDRVDEEVETELFEVAESLDPEFWRLLMTTSSG